MLEFLVNILNFKFYGNTGEEYLVALVIAIASFGVLRIIGKIVTTRLKRLSDKTKTDIDDMLVEVVSKIKLIFYIIISLYIGLSFLALTNWLDMGVKLIFLLVIVFESIQALQRIIIFIVFRALKKGDDESQARSTVKILNIFVQIILWSLGALLILSNMGINVTSLIAGIGIGGIAIALALQSILSDVFASFSILIDKPFQVGDFIIVGSDMGVVQKIGIQTTRLKTLDGQMLIISNQELMSVRVENFYKVQKRRALFNLGVVYETSREQLEAIPKIIQDIVLQTKKTELDRCHFKSYGDFSLNFEVSIYINESDYNAYLDVLQVINLSIFSEFKEKGISFAYPTHLEYQKRVE
ncbi:MAG TPA: mechanosensitive ion channel domain-containing protein [Patescibacteria group bacterium]|nr:mechanosensitive ion channel domain-containing protein [Patescibacteria group bacterium]